MTAQRAESESGRFCLWCGRTPCETPGPCIEQLELERGRVEATVNGMVARYLQENAPNA